MESSSADPHQQPAGTQNRSWQCPKPTWPQYRHIARAYTGARHIPASLPSSAPPLHACTTASSQLSHQLPRDMKHHAHVPAAPRTARLHTTACHSVSHAVGRHTRYRCQACRVQTRTHTACTRVSNAHSSKGLHPSGIKPKAMLQNQAPRATYCQHLPLCPHVTADTATYGQVKPGCTRRDCA